MLLIQVLLIQVSTIIIFDNLYVQNQSTTTAQALARTKTRMTTWLNSNFRGRWKEVSGPNVTLASNQWMIVMRIGKQGGNYDYHYWYEDIYGSYNYGGINVVDYQIPELSYGCFSTTQTSVMEKVRLPGLQQYVNVSTSAGGYGVGAGSYGTPVISSGTTITPVYREPAYTSAEDMERKDGSIGTLKIPSLDINMKVWEGESNASMAKGLGHYTTTSAWDGNVAVCGHNRGAKYVIGDIKDLEIGDTIIYTTIYGTRTYEVVLVKTIASTDWSYLQATADNRITITTCLANQPSKRVCVQAVEVDR